MKLAELNGHWALITGASSGIGREFARQLAHARVNVILVARREERLRELATELEMSHGVQAVPIPLDLMEDKAPFRLRSAIEQRGIKIRLLVNNAATWTLGPFEKSDTLAAFHHVPNWQVAVSEIRRVLKPGGRFLFEHLTKRWLDKWFARTFFLHPVENRLTTAEFVTELERQGIQVDGHYVERSHGDYVFGVGWRR